MNRHYFFIKVNDGSKSYSPETQTVLDVATALNFFSLNPEKTKHIVGAKVRHLTTCWNEKSKGKGPQVHKKQNLLGNTYTKYLIIIIFLENIFFFFFL